MAVYEGVNDISVPILHFGRIYFTSGQTYLVKCLRELTLDGSDYAPNFISWKPFGK
jgi:hypothetical protein